MVAAQRILVVDDEPTVTRGCSRVLGAAGHHVDTAATGREGMDLATTGQFDVVLTDLRLPDLDGMELVRLLRSKRPEVNVIVITGYGSVPSAVEAMRLGVAEYIEKPFTPQEITEAIGRAIKAPPPGPEARIDADAVRQVLRQAGRDAAFGGRVLAEGSRVLSGYSLTPTAKAAIVSGDIAWIEKQCGELSAEERSWLRQRLEAERW